MKDQKGVWRNTSGDNVGFNPLPAASFVQALFPAWRTCSWHPKQEQHRSIAAAVRKSYSVSHVEALVVETELRGPSLALSLTLCLYVCICTHIQTAVHSHSYCGGRCGSYELAYLVSVSLVPFFIRTHLTSSRFRSHGTGIHGYVSHLSVV